MMRTSLDGDRHLDWYMPNDSGMILIEAYPVEDFAKDGTEYMTILPNYPDIGSEYSILCADLLHVATSKYNCIGNRHKGRDIYDMAYMVEEDILPQAWEKFIKHHDEFNFATTTPEKVIDKMNDEKSIAEFEKEWNKDVETGYIANDLNFAQTYDYLLEYLNSFWLD